MKTLLLSLLLVLPAFARIGETPEECTARYGKPSEKSADEDFTTYKFNRFRIRAWFHDGRVEKIDFLKTELKEKEERLYEQERDALLKANALGSEWIASDEVMILARKWTTADGQVIAIQNPHGIAFETTARIQRLENEAKKAAVEKSAGF